MLYHHNADVHAKAFSGEPLSAVGQHFVELPQVLITVFVGDTVVHLAAKSVLPSLPSHKRDVCVCVCVQEHCTSTFGRPPVLLEIQCEAITASAWCS